jgi:long-chain acyl-CoA synthetase
VRLSDLVKRTTRINIGPLLFRTLHRRLGGKLRFLASGGAALPPALAQQYYRLGLLLVQGWGLSETAPVLTLQTPERTQFLFTRRYEREAGTVGRPVPGVRLRLLDVPDKEIWVRERGEGELAAQGPNVSPGYYRNPSATGQAFFEDADGHWFRTGDIGRIAATGDVYITGRVKRVIVLESGEKVNPDEVEEALRQSAYIDDIAVVGRGAQKYLADEKRLEVHAVIYPSREALWQRAAREGAKLSPERAQAWVSEDVKRLQRQLAPYKWVRQVILTDQPLPKTPLGKVRRGLLAEDFEFDPERFAAGANETSNE